MPYEFEDDEYNMHECADCGRSVNSENEPGGVITSDGEFHCADCVVDLFDGHDACD